jgi:hypothetical protein
MQFLLRFSIRDLLWFVLVVAMASGWWLHSEKLSQRYSEQLSHERDEFRERLRNSEAGSNSWREKYKSAVEFSKFLHRRLAKSEGWEYEEGPPSNEY